MDELAAKETRGVGSLLVAFGVAAVVACLSAAFAMQLMAWPVFAAAASTIGYVASTVSTLPPQTSFPEFAKAVLASQWLFLPIYIAIFCIIYPPLSKRTRADVRLISTSMKPQQRFVFCIGTAFLVAMVLADLHILRFPTFLNGGFVNRSDFVPPILRLVFSSRTALITYAWLSVICEATLIWMTMLFCCNFYVYIYPDWDDWKKSQES